MRYVAVAMLGSLLSLFFMITAPQIPSSGGAFFGVFLVSIGLYNAAARRGIAKATIRGFGSLGQALRQDGIALLYLVMGVIFVVAGCYLLVRSWLG